MSLFAAACYLVRGVVAAWGQRHGLLLLVHACPHRLRLSCWPSFPTHLATCLPAHPACRPLPPHLAAALQRTRHAQLQLERRLAMLTPDHDMVHQRNSRVFDLVRASLLPCGHHIALASRGSSVMDNRTVDAFT